MKARLFAFAYTRLRRGQKSVNFTVFACQDRKQAERQRRVWLATPAGEYGVPVAGSVVEIPTTEPKRKAR